MAEMKLITPYEIKNREFQQKPGFIFSRLTYENGLIIEMRQTAEKISVSANRPMVVHPNQSVSFLI